MIQRWGIGAALWLASLGGAYFYGVGVGKDNVRAEMVKPLREAAAALARAHGEIGAARALVRVADGRRAEIVREVYREIPAIVQADPVYRNVCINADGVLLLDRAAAAANGRFTGGPADPAAGSAPDPEDR